MAHSKVLKALISAIPIISMVPAIVDAEDTMHFAAELSTAQAVPAPSGGNVHRAVATADFNLDLSAVQVYLVVRDGGHVVAAHFHCALPGESGPVAFGLFSPGPLAFGGVQAQGTLTNADFTGADCVSSIGRPVNTIAALAFAMREGLIYLNVHTTDNPAGEVRGQMLVTEGAVASIDPMQ